MNAVDAKKAEFIELFRRSGWSQAELARKLEMTRGGVNGYITGPTIPSATALRLFRLTLMGERPEALATASPGEEAALAPWERQVIHALRGLAPRDRARVLEWFTAMLAGYRSRPAARPAATLTDAAVAEVGGIAAAGAQAAVRQLNSAPAGRRKSYRKRHKAVSPSGKTSARAAGAAAP